MVEPLRLLALSDGAVHPDIEGTSGLRELGIPPSFVCDHGHRKHDGNGAEQTDAASQAGNNGNNGDSEAFDKQKGKGKK